MLKLREQLFPVATYPTGHADVAKALYNLGTVHSRQGDFVGAEARFKTKSLADA